MVGHAAGLYAPRTAQIHAAFLRRSRAIHAHRCRRYLLTRVGSRRQVPVMHTRRSGGQEHLTPRHPDLLAAEHDLDGIPAGTVPGRSIVVCAEPGSASDHVADLLRRCGAGIPLEYFDMEAVAAALARRWRVINLDDYITALHRHRSADSGVFGLVLRWRHVRRLHRQVAGIKPLTAERIQQIVTTIAPNPTFVLVRGTGPEHGPVAAAGPSDEPGAIAERVGLREATSRTWLQWFAATGLHPVPVTVGPGGTLAPPEEALIDALGLQSPTRTGR
jgi:LPS sulfotransferase NodH